LRSGASPSLRGIAILFSDEWHTQAWQHLLDCVRTGRPAIDLVYGMSFFEYLSKHPGQSANFFQGMTDFSRIEGPAVAEAYDFSPFRRVCDVGGGLGLLLALILEKHHGIQGVLLDQPKIIENARMEPFFGGLNGRLCIEAYRPRLAGSGVREAASELPARN
jgi:hypothetical protein